MAAIKLVNVPYRSSYMPDLIGGQVQAAFTPILPIGGVHQSGQAARAGGDRRDALGVIAGHSRCGGVRPGLRGLCVGCGRRAREDAGDIVAALNSEINAVLSQPTMQAQFAALGAEPMLMTPAEFGKYIAEETEKWGRVRQDRADQGGLNRNAVNRARGLKSIQGGSRCAPHDPILVLLRQKPQFLGEMRDPLP